MTPILGDSYSFYILNAINQILQDKKAFHVETRSPETSDVAHHR